MAYTKYSLFSSVKSLGPPRVCFRARKLKVGQSPGGRELENAFPDTVGPVWIPQVLQHIYPSLVAIDDNIITTQHFPKP